MSDTILIVLLVGQMFLNMHLLSRIKGLEKRLAT